MKKLWLSAFTAACLVAGSAAHAGDHWRGDHRDNGWHQGWDHGDYRHCDGDDHWRHSHGYGYHEAYYRPVPVYYRPVHYYPVPVYRESRGYGGYGDNIHGSITVGF
jgi:hypothetical protein